MKSQWAYRLRSWLSWQFYTAAQCERDMRRLNNGERGCANPKEHRRKGR